MVLKQRSSFIPALQTRIVTDEQLSNRWAAEATHQQQSPRYTGLNSEVVAEGIMTALSWDVWHHYTKHCFVIDAVLSKQSQMSQGDG